MIQKLDESKALPGVGNGMRERSKGLLRELSKLKSGGVEST